MSACTKVCTWTSRSPGGLRVQRGRHRVRRREDGNELVVDPLQEQAAVTVRRAVGVPGQGALNRGERPGVERGDDRGVGDGTGLGRYLLEELAARVRLGRRRVDLVGGAAVRGEVPLDEGRVPRVLSQRRPGVSGVDAV